MAVAPLNIDVGASGVGARPDEMSRMDSYHHDEGQVIQRFLVTKARSMFATGATIKYIEVMADSSVRIRDAKDSKSADYHYDPINVFERGDSNSEKIFMNDRKNKKKREFKFSSVDEKKVFFQLIEKMSTSTPHHNYNNNNISGNNSHNHTNHLSRIGNNIINGIGGRVNATSPIHSLHKKGGGKQRYTTEKFIKIDNELDPVIMKDCLIKRSGSENEYYGKLIGLTNYRMIVKETFHEEHISATQMMNQHRKNQPLKFNESDPIIPALEIHHNSVNDFDVASDNNKVTIKTKDFRTIIIDFNQVNDDSLKKQYIEMLRRHMYPMDDRDIFAFKAYQTELKKLEKSGLKRGNIEEINLSIFNSLKSTRFDENHKLFLMKREYTRIAKPFGLIDEINEPNSNNNNNNNNNNNVEVPDNIGTSISAASNAIKQRSLPNSPSIHQSPYRLSYANINYELCSTYPKIIMVPSTADDTLLRKASSHRSRQRLPVITWANEYKVTISRCSQPTAGITNKKSVEDMRLLTLLNELNTHSDSYVICDCRPRINAVVNALKGKGYEETSKSYAGSHIIFFDIQNIHQMRSSINAIKKCCEEQESDEWLSVLSSTKWFQHLSKILQCAKRVASMVDKDRYSVLVHCSDGWDRTAQICALSELLLDPYYRKFEGFQILVQKEWLWFGHKFADRNGNYTAKNYNKNVVVDANEETNENAKLSSKKDERSPIFVQFLDTVYQVMKQFPWAFEFTHELLLEYATHVSSGRFGDFFGNCEQEREESQLWVRTGSLFKYLNKLWKSGIFRNPDYTPTSTVLRPRFAVKDIVLWDELYCRFSSHDKDTRLKLNATVTSSFSLGNSQSTTAGMNGATHSGHGSFTAVSASIGGLNMNNASNNSNSRDNNNRVYSMSATANNMPGNNNNNINDKNGKGFISGSIDATYEMKQESNEDVLFGDDEDNDAVNVFEQNQFYRQRVLQLEAMIKEYQKNEKNGNSNVTTPRTRPPPKGGSMHPHSPPHRPHGKPPPKRMNNNNKSDHNKSQTYTKLGGNIV